jgi:hypothetical protein
LEQDKLVFVSGYEGGLEDADCISAKCRVNLNVNNEHWFYGPHEQDESGLFEGYVIAPR